MRRSRISSLSLWGAIAGSTICSAGAGALGILQESNRLNSLTVDAWRPPLLLWAASLLLIASIVSYRTRSRGVGGGGDAGSRRIKAVVIFAPALATVFLAVALALPVLAPAVKGWIEPAWPATLSPNAVRITVSIPTMDCSGCIRGIDAVLRRERGLQKADFSLERKEVAIWYDPVRSSKKSVLEVLRVRGYPADQQE